MDLYLDSGPTRLWNVILKGWELPKATIDGVVTRVTLARSQWNNEQKEENHKNNRAMITQLSFMLEKKVAKFNITNLQKKYGRHLKIIIKAMCK